MSGAGSTTPARIARALRTLSAGNRTLIRAIDERQLLWDMCRVIVDVGGYAIATVLYLAHDEGKRLEPVACAGMELAELQAQGLNWHEADPRSALACSVIGARLPQVDRSFAEPELLCWQDEARRRGLAANSVYPLIVDHEVVGLLAISAGRSDSHAFGTDELAILNELAEDLAFGIAIVRGRAQHEEADRTIRRMAYFDGMTGLPNRVQLRERLVEAIIEARQSKRSLALLMIDVDRFREINEVLGYSQGDALLVALAQRLANLLSPGQVLARVGVDEFALVAPHMHIEDARTLAEHVLRKLEEPFELARTRVEIRASIGIALYPGHATEAEALILRADAAAYQAKRARREVAVFAGDSEEASRERVALIGDLRHAIDTHQLRLYCQPKADLKSRAICGAEALVRWEHPERGMIPPDRFVPLAESTGLIHSLTYWAIDAGLGNAYSMHEAGLVVPLAVNLSARDLQDPRLVDRISGLLTTWGAHPDWLDFELTESALMEDPEGAKAVLKRLRAMGFRLFIDDYGTGYSSLSYLQRLPIHAIKIDQSFVRDMLRHEESRTIVRSTVDMAHSIGLDVVAEGAENKELWDQLKALDVDVAQGWYIAKPFPADQFQQWRASGAWTCQ